MAGDNVFEEAAEDFEQPEEGTQEATPAAEPVQTEEAGPTEDDIFSFLDNDAGPDEEEAVAPQEGQEATPPSSPPVPASQPSAFERVAEQMAAFLENQNKPAAPATEQQAAPAWVDPFERPENVARIQQLEDDAMFQAEAAKELRQLERRLTEEKMRHEFSSELAATQARTQSLTQLGTVQDAAYRELAQGAAYVDRPSFDAATEEFIADVFGGDRIAFAAAASNPQIKKQIANNAELRAIKNRATRAPTAKPTTTARPAAVPSAASPAPRSTGTGGRSYSAVEIRLANDPDFESDVSGKAFGIGPKKRTN